MTGKTNKRECGICRHFNKKAINKRLLQKRAGSKESYASIARDFEHVTTPMLIYHLREHLPLPEGQTEGTASKNRQQQKIDPDDQPSKPEDQPEGTDSLDDCSEVDLQAKENDAWKMFDQFTAAGDPASALKAADIALKCMTARDRRSDEGRNQVVNITDTPEYQEMMDVVLRVLDKYPEAREALTNELAELTAKT